MFSAEGQKVVREAVEVALQEHPITAVYKIGHLSDGSGVDILSPDGQLASIIRWPQAYKKCWRHEIFTDAGVIEKVIAASDRITVERLGDVLRKDLIGTETRHLLKAERLKAGCRLKDLADLMPIPQERLSEFERGQAVPTQKEWNQIRLLLEDLPERWTR